MRKWHHLAIVTALFWLGTSSAGAASVAFDNSGRWPAMDAGAKVEKAKHVSRRAVRVARERPKAKLSFAAVKRTVERVSRAVEILPHPSGCPRRAFCGCGASIEIFGRPVRSLFLAANWFKFPRAQLAPGTVAVRKHHVVVVRQPLGHNTALVYDANSGGHKTRLHVRNLSGFVIVDPRGGRG